MCSFFKDDFLIVKDKDSDIIVNRNFSEIYRSNFSYVEDMGIGLLKVFSEDDFVVIHKVERLFSVEIMMMHSLLTTAIY